MSIHAFYEAKRTRNLNLNSTDEEGVDNIQAKMQGATSQQS